MSHNHNYILHQHIITGNIGGFVYLCGYRWTTLGLSLKFIFFAFHYEYYLVISLSFLKYPKLLKDKLRTSVTVPCALVYCLFLPFPKHSKPKDRHCVLSKSQNNSVVLECRLGLSMLTKRHRSWNILVMGVPLTFDPKLPAQEYSSPQHAKRCFL
jgi:hypothetical protein